MNSKQRSIVEKRIQAMASDAKSQISKVSNEKAQKARDKELANLIPKELLTIATRLRTAIRKDKPRLAKMLRELENQGVNIGDGLLRKYAIESQDSAEIEYEEDDTLKLGIFSLSANYRHTYGKPVQDIVDKGDKDRAEVSDLAEKAIFKLWMEKEAEAAEKMFEEFSKAIAKLIA